MLRSLIVLLFVLTQGFTSFAGTPCEDDAAETLADMDIEAELAATDKVKAGGKSNLIVGYLHWFRTPQCDRGYVVVRTTRSCQILSVYTQTGCKIDGLKAWW